MVLMLCEMQSLSSKIWTRVAVSISCDDNHYTMGTSLTPRAPPKLLEIDIVVANAIGDLSSNLRRGCLQCTSF